MSGKLKIGDSGELRHYLEGEPVHCGKQLKLLVAPNFWVWARYEASVYTEQNRIGVVLFTTFGRVVPDETTVLRWPTEDER